MADRDRPDTAPTRSETVEAIRFFETQPTARATSEMSDMRATARSEPILDTGPGLETASDAAAGGPEPPQARAEPPHARAPDTPVPLAPVAPAAPIVADRRSSSEQLARLEDKASRIEEKLARSESNTQRVVDRFELASARMGEVASQAELTAVRGEVSFIARRVRSLPGFSALIVTALITAVLTSALTAVVLRFLPGIIGR